MRKLVCSMLSQESLKSPHLKKSFLLFRLVDFHYSVLQIAYLFFCFKTLWAIQGLSQFHMNLRIGFSISGEKKKAIRILVGITLDIQIALNGIALLKY